jgi:galactose mutarotase-like enzyme
MSRISGPNGKKYTFNMTLGKRDAGGRAHFSIESGGKKVETLFGPRYPVAVVWEPPAPEGQTRDFICFEPMTGITSAVNLQHEASTAACKR